MRKLLFIVTFAFVGGWMFSPAWAMRPLDDAKRAEIESVQILHKALLVSPVGDYHSHPDAALLDQPGWSAFLGRYGSKWDISVDHRSGRPDLIQGQGIPWVPGKGNKLSWTDMKKRYGANISQEVSLELLAMIAEVFMDENAELFHLDRKQLQFDVDGSFLSDTYASLRFSQVVNGVKVRKSHVFFRVNHGNLIQFGTHFYEDVSISTKPDISEEKAFNIASDYLNKTFSGAVDLTKPIRLLIVPVASEGDQVQLGESYRGKDGQGYAHRLVYEMFLKAAGTSPVWQVLVDAHSGDILIFQDYRKFATIDGGIYPVTNSDTEVVRPFPYARVTNGSAKQTDAGGNYDYSGGTATCTLNGVYVTINDDCGSVSLSTSSSPGDLHFGTSSGTDCTTPGFGGSGNTHSARSCFYHINKLKEKIRYYQPSMSWINQNLTANVNLDDTCNAYWDGSSVNFFKSGGGCSNTGEIASVFLHETSHGVDENDPNGFTSDHGSAEAYADIGSFLMTHESCIGHNFTPGSPCDFGCDSSCTGVRDVDTATNVTVSNIENYPADCDRWSCPYYGYSGVMGYEGHCESLIASQAWWDAIKAVRADIGDDAGWAWADRLWYTGISSFDNAYQVVSGGQCNPSATVNGCNSDSYYTVLLGIDDDDGNLSNGTPHGCRLWEQFNIHGIACGSQPACYSSCPTIGTPSVTGSSGGGNVILSWSAVSNAVEYEIFRNDIGCDFGWNPLGTTTSTTYTDTEVAEGTTYYYVVQGIGSDSDCRGPMSSCVSVTVTAGPTPTPAPPTSTPLPTFTPTTTPTPTNTPPPAPILLVDDDNGSSYEAYFETSLNNLGRSYDVWTVSSQGSPPLSTLNLYDLVIWFTGDDYQTTLTSTDESNLGNYLDNGGKLFITGQDIGYDINSDTFYANYLHAVYDDDDTGDTTLTGLDIFSGRSISISGGDGADNQSYPSQVHATGGGVECWQYDTNIYGGVRYTGTYCMVYFSWGFEAINSQTDRDYIMDDVLGYMDTCLGVPTDTPVPPTSTPAPPTNTPAPPTNTPASPTDTPTPTPTEPCGETDLFVMDNDCSAATSNFAGACDPASMDMYVGTDMCPTDCSPSDDCHIGWSWDSGDSGIHWQYFITPVLTLDCTKNILFDMCYGFDGYDTNLQGDFYVYWRCADGGATTDCSTMTDSGVSGDWQLAWSDTGVDWTTNCSSRTVTHQEAVLPCTCHSVEVMIAINFDAYADQYGFGYFRVYYDSCDVQCSSGERNCPDETPTPAPPTNTPIPTNTPVPPTSTPVPPTSTPAPPTYTPTQVPPTSTPVYTPSPTPTPIPPILPATGMGGLFVLLSVVSFILFRIKRPGA